MGPNPKLDSLFTVLKEYVGLKYDSIYTPLLHTLNAMNMLSLAQKVTQRHPMISDRIGFNPNNAFEFFDVEICSVIFYHIF